MVDRIKLAHRCLKGISIGDAFGDSFFGDIDYIHQCISDRTIPKTKWEFTDDTIMSMAIYEELKTSGTIDQNSLIQRLVKNHSKDPNRGYGATARRILREVEEGGDWKEIASGVFDGMGSMGNGAAMRVGPIGAYYFDDLEKVKELARVSSEVTHMHLEAIAGAIAVAVATALTTQISLLQKEFTPEEFIREVCQHVPESDTKSKINKSLSVPYSYHIESVKSILGNGSQIIAQDTVPFSIWCAAYNLNNFEESLWKAVSILGDRDTICAIVGGITSMSSDENTVPTEWLNSVEDMDTW